MYSTPPCPSLAASTAAYRRRSFSDSHPKNRRIFCSTSAPYPSMPHSLIQNVLCGNDTTASAIREVILDHILSRVWPGAAGGALVVSPRIRMTRLESVPDLEPTASCHRRRRQCRDRVPQQSCREAGSAWPRCRIRNTPLFSPPVRHLRVHTDAPHGYVLRRRRLQWLCLVEV